MTNWLPFAAYKLAITETENNYEELAYQLLTALQQAKPKEDIEYLSHYFDMAIDDTERLIALIKTYLS